MYLHLFNKYNYHRSEIVFWILSNIWSNCAKFTQNGVKIQVSLLSLRTLALKANYGIKLSSNSTIKTSKFLPIYIFINEFPSSSLFCVRFALKIIHFFFQRKNWCIFFVEGKISISVFSGMKESECQKETVIENIDLNETRKTSTGGKLFLKLVFIKKNTINRSKEP